MVPSIFGENMLDDFFDGGFFGGAHNPLYGKNAKNLMNALMENVQRYEAMFGEIKPKTPRNNPANGGNNQGEIPNPFMFGGNA